MLLKMASCSLYLVNQVTFVHILYALCGTNILIGGRSPRPGYAPRFKLIILTRLKALVENSMYSTAERPLHRPADGLQT